MARQYVKICFLHAAFSFLAYIGYSGITCCLRDIKKYTKFLLLTISAYQDALSNIFLSQLIPPRSFSTQIVSQYQLEHKQPSQLRPQEMTSYFNGKRMAVMYTMTVTTVELTPTDWAFDMWRRVMVVTTGALWGMRLKEMEKFQKRPNLLFVSAHLIL